MARGSNTATAAANSAAGLSGQLERNAGNEFNFLAPELQSEAVNPQGFNPAAMAKMNTAAKQTAGGTQAGAVGQGALLASRTKNPGTGAAAIGESARAAGQQLANEDLKTQVANEELKQTQRQNALKGIEGLTGLETTSGIQSAGQIGNDVNANTNAANASWDWAKNILDPLISAGGAVGAKFAGA